MDRVQAVLLDFAERYPQWVDAPRWHRANAVANALSDVLDDHGVRVPEHRIALLTLVLAALPEEPGCPR